MIDWTLNFPLTMGYIARIGMDSGADLGGISGSVRNLGVGGSNSGELTPLKSGVDAAAMLSAIADNGDGFIIGSEQCGMH